MLRQVFGAGPAGLAGNGGRANLGHIGRKSSVTAENVGKLYGAPQKFRPPMRAVRDSGRLGPSTSVAWHAHALAGGIRNRE
jgi:hypothetical protein